jgi:molybdopterin molybdotransferase
MRDLSVEAARARMLGAAGPVRTETVALDAGRGRTLAEPITASRDQPPFDTSAMDGWAVRGSATGLTIVGESAAGRGYSRPLLPGQAVRIFTGAPVPPGADRVVIQEEATRDGDRLRVPPDAGAGRFIRPRGGDFRAGQVLLPRGVRLDPWRLALVAASGRAELTVAGRPQVVVLSTGEEIAPAGSVAGPHQIFDSGGPAIRALIEAWGGTARRLASTGDDEAAIADAVQSAGGELIVTIGGASVGDHDLVKPALARLGLELMVETVNVRPGKPTWFGRLADGRRVLGLPGNPASALVCAELFLRPLLMAMQGADPALKLSTAQLLSPARANGAREHWMRARLSVRDGRLQVEPMSDQDSSLVSVFAESNALIRWAPNAPAAEIGAVVEVLPLERL